MRGSWVLSAAAAAVLAGTGCASTPEAGGTPGGGPAEAARPAPPTEEEMNAAWTKAMTPGEEHARLARQCGEWDVAGKMWMAPGGPPTEMRGTATFRMVLGGRYQVQEYRGTFMEMSFEGMSIAGYDNVRKVHFASWIDSLGTSMMDMEGTPDAPGTLTCRGEMPDPLGDVYRVRSVMTEKGPDSFLFEMFMQGAQWPEESKSMELLYTRRK